jgi:hypothetical protein
LRITFLKNNLSKNAGPIAELRVQEKVEVAGKEVSR